MKSGLRMWAERNGGLTVLIVVSALFFVWLYWSDIACMCMEGPPQLESLERNDIQVELVGIESKMESPDFYIIETAENNWVNTGIHCVSSDDEIYLFAGSNWREPVIHCNLMTAWDEMICPIDIDLSRNNYINGYHLIPVYNTLQIVEVEAYKDSFSKMESCENKEIKCHAYLYTESVRDSIGVEFKGRGNTTWNMYGKRPFSIKTDKSVNTFGIGEQKKWNLLANAHDKTLLKNEVWFNFARGIGLQYTPNSTLVHLFVNGEYRGIYEVTTKIKQDDVFLPLAHGDYLINIGGTNPEQRVEFEAQNWEEAGDELDGKPYADISFPKNMSRSEEERIQVLLQEMFNAIDGDSDEQLESIVDMESFARLYWIEEISMNADAPCRSIYCYWDNSRGKFIAGPLWDMDYTIGSTMGKGRQDFTTPEGWKVSQIGFWKGLMKHECFINSVQEQYETRHIEDLMDNSVQLYRDLENAIGVEAQLDFMEHMEENQFDELDRDFSSYKTYTDDTIKFMEERVNWIKHEVRSKGVDTSGISKREEVLRAYDAQLHTGQDSE